MLAIMYQSLCWVKLRPFQDNVEVIQDLVYEALTEPSAFDTECEMFLSVILSAMTKYV